MGLSIEIMTNYFLSRTVDSLPEETFATFVVPNSVTLTRRQTEILSSLQTRQGVPFCLDYEGTLSKPQIEAKKKLRIARGLLVIEEDTLFIQPDGEVHFKYTCFDLIEVQFNFFAKDSNSRDAIRIDKSMLKWGPIVLSTGTNRLFKSSRRVAVSSLPFMQFNGRAVAKLYDVVITVSPTTPSSTDAVSQSDNNAINRPDVGTSLNISRSQNQIERNLSAIVQQEAFYFRVAKPAAAALSDSAASTAPAAANQSQDLLSSFDSEEGATNIPNNTIHKAKVVLHRFMLAEGIYDDIGGVFSTSSSVPSTAGDLGDAADPAPNTHHPLRQSVDREMDEKSDGGSDADEGRAIPSTPRRSSVAVPSRAETDAVSEPRAATESDCVICMTAACDIINYPCRHSCMCLACASDIASGAATREGFVRCPICRVTVKAYLRVVGAR